MLIIKLCQKTMRREFKDILLRRMEEDARIVVYSADLGYGMMDSIRDKYEKQRRFVNCGSAEQLMIGMAIGAALTGKIPVCFSITSFLLRRGYEGIKLYVNDEKIPIRLLGGGRNKDYLTQGKTHWMEDDRHIMAGFPNITPFWPETVEELEEVSKKWLYQPGPSYLNLKR